MDTLISNVTVVTMNERMEVLFDAYLGVEGTKITYLEKFPPKEAPKTIIEGAGMVVMPGLINCHTQLASTLMRSLCDDLSTREALEQRLMKEDKMDARSAKASALLGIAECLRFGVTSVSDLYYYPDATAQAMEEAGIKGNVALSAYRFIDACEDFDFDSDEQCQELCRITEKWNGFDHGRIRVDAGIHAEYTSNYKLWQGLVGYACEQKLGFQLHLAETSGEVESCEDRTGMGPGELLNCHGVFNVPVTAADCACLSPEERKLLGKKKASAVAMPLAAAKYGRYSTPVLESVKAGMNVALGTGGAVACGNLDLFEVMRGVSLAERASAGDASALPAQAVLMMATVCGARAQGRAAECGMLKVGMDADLALLDFTAPHLMPCHNVLTGLVFSAKGGDVAMTMVRGKVLYRSGTFPTIDLKEVVKELGEYAIPRLFPRSE